MFGELARVQPKRPWASTEARPVWLSGNTGHFSKVKWFTPGLGLWEFCSVRLGETRRPASAHLLGFTKQNGGVSQHSSMKLPQVPAVCPMSRDLFSHLQPLLWVREVPLHLSFPWLQQALELQGCLGVPWRRKRNTVCWKRGQGAHTPPICILCPAVPLEQRCV